MLQNILGGPFTKKKKGGGRGGFSLIKRVLQNTRPLN